MRIWADFVTTRIVSSFHRFLQYQPGQSSSTIDDVRNEYLSNLKQFTQAMDQSGSYFSGKEPMLIDFILAPWAIRHWVFNKYKGGLGVPAEGQGGADEETWGRWRQWTDAIESRRSVKETISEKEHYLPIYQK